MTFLPGTRLAASTLALTTCLLLGACSGGGGSIEFLSIGTAGTGGIYYPLGGGLAARLSAADSMRQYTAEVTGGSVENVNRVMTGQIDLAFSLAITLYDAYHGQGDYETARPELRILAPLYPNVTHILVAQGSSVTRFEELRGRRLSVGPAGSGTEQMSRQLLSVHGMDYDDVEERFLSFTESSAALRDGALDGAIISVGYPAAAVLEATTAGGARLIPLDESRVAALVEEYPYYAPSVVPSGIYPGVEAPVPTVEMNNWIIGRADLEEAVVQELIRVLTEERAYLIGIHEMAGRIDMATLTRAPIPLHGVSERWLADGLPR